ncbi:hypothetical protein FAES_2986 [Fibrella aestuarina BUZ 2]|uniref:Uncharacterized protein n=2 Tax=Fibrella TaxID=861914 RepID=I0KA42_9BACT|nr:hypothetical protein FAES_2986 [Fibrella aestuarina BUZ 2]
MPKPMRIVLLALAALSGGVLLKTSDQLVHTKGADVTGTLPPQTSLTPTPRSSFTPTTRKGYWNADVVGDFVLPKTKTLTFDAAGRNLYGNENWEKIFKRGFSSVSQARMFWGTEIADSKTPPGWKSRLSFDRRAFTVTRAALQGPPHNVQWALNGNLAGQTYFRPPANDPNSQQNIYAFAKALGNNCILYGDCPASGPKIGVSKLFLDFENDGVDVPNRQEQANMYTYLMKAIKDVADPRTEIGSLTPVAHNGFGYSRAADYESGGEWLFSMPAQHTATSRQRGMPDAIVGKSYSDYIDFNMPGTYHVFPDYDYTASHRGDYDRHWLAGLLSEQEYNIRLSNKKRIAWHWLFNTQGPFNRSERASNPAPPAVAEGMGVFFWFTGAYGAILWDDYNELKPDQPTPADPNLQGLGSDRNYACYEHYIHGLWRLFKHHGDLFNGRETYLNQQTECSFDGGKTWYQYNANQLKTRGLPFARAVINGDQILVAATMPFAKPDQRTSLMVRYIQNGYQFYTTVNLKADEIFLGRATMGK